MIAKKYMYTNQVTRNNYMVDINKISTRFILLSS